MGFWGPYLVDEGIPYSEYATTRRVRDGIDPTIKAIS
jgi:hypothetical protein